MKTTRTTGLISGGTIMRRLLGVFVGLVSGSLVIILIQLLTHTLFTLPDALHVTDYGTIILYHDQIPRAAVYSVVFGWVIAAFVASFVSTKLGKDISLFSAGFMAVAYCFLGTYVMIDNPHPAWLWFVALGGIIVSAIYAGQLASRVDME